MAGGHGAGRSGEGGVYAVQHHCHYLLFPFSFFPAPAPKMSYLAHRFLLKVIS